MNDKIAIAQASKNRDNISKILIFLEKIPEILQLEQIKLDKYKNELEELQKTLR